MWYTICEVSHRSSNAVNDHCRLWRMKRDELIGSSIALSQHKDNIFLTVAFNASGNHLFAGTANGTLLQIRVQDLSLQCVFTLHSAAIYSVQFTRELCVTG